MGADDAAEMLLAAQAECLRLERALAAATADALEGRTIAGLDSRGLMAIATERSRQINFEGYTPLHDVGHELDLTRAAYCYLDAAINQMIFGDYLSSPLLHVIPPTWPWAREDWKPDPDPTRNLVKAGALAAAAVDARLAAAAALLEEPVYREGGIGDE